MLGYRKGIRVRRKCPRFSYLILCISLNQFFLIYKGPKKAHHITSVVANITL